MNKFHKNVANLFAWKIGGVYESLINDIKILGFGCWVLGVRDAVSL